MRKIDPKEIKTNAIKLIEEQWMLITAGTIDNFNTMTANWGALGELWYKHVAFVFVRPQRYTYQFTESNDMMTLSFFGEEYREALQFCGKNSGRDTDKVAETGLTPMQTENGSVAFEEAELVLECRKLYVDKFNPESFVDKAVVERCYKRNDYHRVYVVEIINAWVK